MIGSKYKSIKYWQKHLLYTNALSWKLLVVHTSSLTYLLRILNFFVQLLGRVFNILRENNPELAGDRRRTVMRPPQVLREGTKKTVFVNFMDLCKTYVTILFKMLNSIG